MDPSLLFQKKIIELERVRNRTLVLYLNITCLLLHHQPHIIRLKIQNFFHVTCILIFIL